MSNLDNLSSKIVEDANIKAEAILKDARNSAASIIESKVKDAGQQEVKMLEKAKIEAGTVKQRVISNARLMVRNEKLTAMQSVVDRVFQESLEVLSKINEEQYLQLVKSYLMSMDISGNEEIILPSKYKDIVTEEHLQKINVELKASGKIGDMKLSLEDRNINSGFIVLKNGIEINNTFESLVNSLRDELESEIVKELFN